jgi:hypothetical protein
MFESHINYGTHIREYNWYNKNYENREKEKASEYTGEIPYT